MAEVVVVIIGLHEQLVRGHEKDRREHECDPLKLVHHGDSERDHYAPHQDRAHDSPREHTPLVLEGHPEVVERHQKDEQVVHAFKLRTVHTYEWESMKQQFSCARTFVGDE